MYGLHIAEDRTALQRLIKPTISISGTHLQSIGDIGKPNSLQKLKDNTATVF